MFLNNSEDISFEALLESNGILSEAYYGKNPLLLKCEEHLAVLKQDLNKGINVNKSKEKEDIEQLFAELFGFEKVYFCILAEERFMNAFTVPFFNQADYSKDDNFFKLEKNSNGIRFKSAKGKFLYIYVYTYTIRNMSIENIMSVILHEIGHNFFLVKEQVTNCKARISVDLSLMMLKYLNQNNWSPACYNECLKFISEMGYMLNDVQMSYYDEFKKLMTNKIQEKSYKEHKKQNNFFYKAFWKVIYALNIPIELTSTAINVLFIPFLMMNKKSREKDLKNNSIKTQDYNAEKFSDNFAMSYGYAVGVASTFNNTSKLSYDNSIRATIPILRITDYFNNTLIMFISYYNDPHPSNMSRVLFAIKKLKHELKNEDINPKQRAEIEGQLMEMEAMLKDAPYYKKFIDKLFEKGFAKRDKIGTQTYSDEEIFDFDEKLFDKNLK